ncbi:MAG: hypothetical protein QXU79_03400 [Candidatus Micrarchaeaceae archaeon]
MRQIRKGLLQRELNPGRPLPTMPMPAGIAFLSYLMEDCLSKSYNDGS